MKDKIIGLIDGNNFFASCEILMNPSLRNKPVCVLSNNDGCVIARSNEAKKLGIKMGMPYFMAKREFKGVTYLSANFALYHDLSERMMEFLKQYSNKIDVYSIDEAFIDLSGCDKIFKMNYKELAEKIKKDIETNIGLNVSVGIANSKILAKIANHKAKKRKGSYVIERHLIKEEIQNMPIEEIWGIGRNIARSLRKYGIFYADEILLKDDNFYKSIYGKKGLELKYELEGKSVIPLTGENEKPKSIQRTRAFPEFSKDKEYIKTELNMHLHNVCKKLREHNLETGIISVMLRTKDFKVYFKEKKLNFTTNSEVMLLDITDKLFESVYKEGIIYRSSGIWAYLLTDTENTQLNLFSDSNTKKANKISSLLDKLEDKYGKNIITLGSTGIKSIAQTHKRIMNFIST